MNKSKILTHVICLYFCCCLCLDMVGQPSSPREKDLNVRLVEQTDSKWCWAAGLEMLFKFHSTPKDTYQCHIAATHFRIKPLPLNLVCNCSSYCTNSTANCSQAIVDSDLLRLFNNYGYNSWRTAASSTINWDTVKLKIDNLRPFIFSHVIRNGPNQCDRTHYLVAKGYCEKGDCNFVLVNDPSICKSQNIVAVKFNNLTTFKICTATLDNQISSATVTNAVNTNSNICSNILNCSIANIRLPPVSRVLAMRSSAKQAVIDTTLTVLNVEYINIENNKVVKVNEQPIKDIITGSVFDSANYVINRVVKVGDTWETEMVLRGKYKGSFDIDKTLEPLVTINGKKFTLNKNLYKKVVLLPDYQDYLQFNYKSKTYFYPLNNCGNCNNQPVLQKEFIKQTFMIKSY